MTNLHWTEKKKLKHVLSVPVNTADAAAAVYILTGLLPLEAHIQKKTHILQHCLSSIPRPDGLGRKD